MPEPPKCYEDWLALSNEERDKIHFKIWKVYERDGIGFAYAAAGRLAAQSPFKVYDLAIGIYHRDEYLLELFLHPDEFLESPRMFEEKFEGFRVRYSAESGLVIEEFEKKGIRCPKCSEPFTVKSSSFRSAGMQHDGSYFVNCSD